MRKGGYQILDFSNYKFTGNQTLEIRGIYDILEANTSPVYISGLDVAQFEYNDEFCVVYKYSTAYIIIHSEIILYIDDNDIVKAFKKSDSYVSITDPSGNCNALAVALFAAYTNRIWFDDVTESYTVAWCTHEIYDGMNFIVHYSDGTAFRITLNLTNNRYESVGV